MANAGAGQQILNNSTLMQQQQQSNNGNGSPYNNFESPYQQMFLPGGGAASNGSPSESFGGVLANTRVNRLAQLDEHQQMGLQQHPVRKQDPISLSCLSLSPLFPLPLSPYLRTVHVI